MPQAARVADVTGHGPPLSPGPGALTVLVGGMPAWRALPLSMAGAVEGISNVMNSFMLRPQLTPVDATVSLGQISAALIQGGAVAAANGMPAAVGTAASMVGTLVATNVTLTAAWTAASAVPGGQPAASIAYTEGIKAAAAAAASAVVSAMAGISDMHLCPIPVPIPPHGPGFVTRGSPTVRIEKLPAVRQLDQVFEACGGPDPIVIGLPTVLIGDVGMGMRSFGQAGGVNSAIQALATRRPTAAEIQEIQDALDAGNRQRAADLAVRYYGIDTANVPGGIRYDATVADYGVTSFDGRIRLGPTAFASPEVLASTIAHETTHSNQAAAMRASDPTLTDWPASTVDYDEAVAYDTEVRSAHQTGLESNPAEFEIARSRRETHNGNLSAGDQTDYGNGGYPP